MKQKIDIELTATVSLDEIAEQLVSRLTPEQLAEFVVGLGDNMGDCISYYEELDRLLKDIDFDDV